MKEILFNYMRQYTSLTDDEQRAIVDQLVIEAYPKGTVLIRQGEPIRVCYFVLQGCVRQFAVDVKGKETTSDFYTEEQFIAVFTSDKEETLSKFSFVCSEDCVLVVGELNKEADMFAQYGQLVNMTRRMIELNASTVKDDFASYISASPEERFRLLLQQRPDLPQRVPQHQLASYLGITPESLSRIKRRVQ